MDPFPGCPLLAIIAAATLASMGHTQTRHCTTDSNHSGVPALPDA